MDDPDNIHPGQLAPDFTLPDQDGRMHTLSEYRGQWVFLYFYPKDDTSGCTVETCAIRDHFDAFKRFNVKIFGMSTDSAFNHKRFAARCNLPFALLSDAHKKVARKYSTFSVHPFDSGEEKIERISFLIDVMGEIEKVYRNVKPRTHAEEVLKDLAAMKKESEERIEL